MEGSAQSKPESVVQTGAISKKKKEDKKSKRDPKFPENLFKSIASNTISEKLQTMEERYKELYSEYRNALTNCKAAEKRLEGTYREKDHVENDLNKARLARAKVEALARELQRQNKEIKEENYNRLKEEEEKRKAVAANFTEKLNTLTSLMDENRDKSLRLREENLSMTSKLTDLYNQFQDRELSLANMNKQVELQKKLTETQLKKLEVEFETEREVWAKERIMLVANLERSEEANSLLQENIKALQSHIDSYQKQYCDFENTMQRSNKVFDTFKHEMEKLKKINAKLEKEKEALEERCTSNAQTILRCTTAIEHKNREISKLNTRHAAIEKLARQALSDRSLFMKQLIDYGLMPANLNPTNPPNANTGFDNSSAAEGNASTAASDAAAPGQNLPLATLCDLLEIPPDVQANILKVDKDVAKYKESFKELAESLNAPRDQLPPPESDDAENEVDEVCCRLEAACAVSTADQEGAADEPAQDFDRIPPLPTDIVPDKPQEVPHKGKGKKKKAGNATAKRARDARSQGDAHSLKPYNLHVAESFPQQFDGMMDRSLLPECDIGLPVADSAAPVTAPLAGSTAPLAAPVAASAAPVAAPVVGSAAPVAAPVAASAAPVAVPVAAPTAPGSDEPESTAQEDKD